ncbi:MAG: rRNA maturation RNase YbeY [Micavibrio aeruginosavorus]|uniref:Endoribonuclease YbeY n=1 Tax=Micavibrio aeruginosavorus TaxID=349221 RepID=A0A7T5R0Z4_9BACT|nr:MAG: rRNA maturation RNase YbeY [Micavibrio aeruginosavorus]
MPRPSLYVDIDLVVNHPAWEDTGIDLKSFADEVVGLTLAMADLPEGLSERGLEICVVLTDDSEIHSLNRDYRGMDKPTNVLSFANLDSDSANEELAQDDMPFFLGDIIIAWETMQREALEQHKEFLAHLRHMMVHGALHLLGYNHMDDEEASEMEGLEIKILEKMNVENPYAEDQFVA